MTKIAIAQESPVILNREQTLTKAVDLIATAASEGAELIVFPEAFISGYPAWIWRLRPGGDWGDCEHLHARLLENAINLDAGDFDPILDAAKKQGIYVVCGANEIGGNQSKGTVYNSVLTVDNHGQLVNRHRKLMPTNPERMVWGFGDASGLRVIDTPFGKIGQLICWENYMPLARYALYSQGVELYIAPTYDSGDGWTGTMQHIAREGRCWVVSSGVALRRSDIPEDFPNRDSIYPDAEDWINPGDSSVIAPGGEIVAGPMNKETGILYADIDTSRVAAAKRALDVAGHYSRPDVFTLTINTEQQSSFETSE